MPEQKPSTSIALGSEDLDQGRGRMSSRRMNEGLLQGWGGGVMTLVCWACALTAVWPAKAAQWPQFRGPSGLGYSDDKNLALTWGGKSNENIVWKVPLTGQGHASPIVWDDAVFVGTV